MQKYFLHTKIKCVKSKHLDKKYKKLLFFISRFIIMLNILFKRRVDEKFFSSFLVASLASSLFGTDLKQ